MHVRDEDADDVAVEPRENVLPRRLHQAEAGVDERPAVAPLEEVAVDVPRAGRKRHRHADDAGLHAYQLVSFPGVYSHAWKNVPRSSPESRSAVRSKVAVVAFPKRFSCA